MRRIIASVLVLIVVSLPIGSAFGATVNLSGLYYEDDINRFPARNSTFILTGDSQFGWQAGTISGPINLGGYTLGSETGGGNPTTISGAISGTGNYYFNGGGGDNWPDTPSYLKGSGANTFTGSTTIKRGTLVLQKTAGVTAVPGPVFIGDAGASNRAVLKLGANNQISDNSVMTFRNQSATEAGYAFFRLNSYSETVGGLVSYSTGDGVIENASAATSNSTLTVNPGAGKSYTYSGMIRNASATGNQGAVMNLVKTGAGTQVLAGTNIYTGSTVISAGTLTLNSLMPQATITVSGTGVLNGMGTIKFLDGQTITDTGRVDASGGMLWDLSALSGSSPTLLNFAGGTFTSPSILNNLLAPDSYSVGWRLSNTGTSIIASLTAVTEWNVDANGNWSDATKWSGGVPNGAGSPANFLGKITVPRTVTVNAPVSVGLIKFDNANKYTLVGTALNAITLNTASGDAMINVVSGSHEIAAPVVMDRITDVTVTPAGGTLTISGNMSGAASGLGLNKAGAGTLFLKGTNTFDGPVVVSAGTLKLGGGHAIADSVGMTVNGTLDLNGSDETMRSVAVSGGNVLMNGGTLRISTASNLNNLTGSGAVYKTGNNTLTLSNNGSFSGAFNLAGTVAPSGAGAFGDATGTTTFSGATWSGISTTVAGSENFAISGAGHKTVFSCTSGSPVIAGNVDIQFGSILELQNTGGYVTTFNGSISGSGSFLWWGGSSASFLGGSSANTLGGAFTLEQGTLALAKTSGITAIAGPLVLGGGGSVATIRLDQSNGISDNSPITMTGDYNVTMQTQGNSETVGSLTLAANGYIDMGTGTSTIRFADSSAQTWKPTRTLTVQNYTSSSDHLYFGSSAGALAAAQLSQLRFENPAGYAAGIYTANMLSTGEIVPGQTPAPSIPQPVTLSNFKLVPYPVSVQQLPGTMTVGTGSRIVLGSPNLASLGGVLSNEIYALTGKRLQVAYGTPSSGDISLKLDSGLTDEKYTMSVQNQAVVSGGNYQSVAQGTATLLQMLKTTAGTTTLQQTMISDSPADFYRATMIDLARQPHSISTIEQQIELNRLYKVPYLQLHLTDDQAFTFTVDSVAGINGHNYAGSSDHRLIPTYTKQELVDLVKFAADRGVTLVPELELAGHAGQMVSGRPDLFRTGWYHGSTLNIANPDAITAIKSILSEVAGVFTTSPYIHIGADEADYSQLNYGYVSDPNNPSVTPAARAQWDSKMDQLTTQLRASGDIPAGDRVTSALEVYRDYINQMDDYVRSLGKETIVWEGFGQSGQVPMNKDIIVMNFEQTYYNPASVVKDGFRSINASWSPLYVVSAQNLDPNFPTGAGFCAATVQQIYNWDKQKFDVYYGNVSSGSQTNVYDAYADMILGGQLTAWENTEAVLIGAMRQRLAATSERLWSPASEWTYDDFASRMSSTDAMLDPLLLSNETSVLSDWKVDAGGTWTTMGNWTASVPAGGDSVARFLGTITAPRTVTLNAPTTVGQLVFDSASKYTISGTSALTLSSYAGAAITINRGSHDINTNVILATDTLVNVGTAGDTLTLGGTVSGAGNLVKFGPGKLNLTQPITTTGFISVLQGEMDLTRLNESANTTVTVGAGASLLADRIRGNALTVNGTTTLRSSGLDANVSIFDATHTLTIGATGEFDLANNSMIVKGGSLATIQSQVKSAYANGAWTGYGITTSTGVAGTGLGVDTAGHLNLTSFAGQTVAATDVLVKYTWLGDVDFSGTVDFSDFLKLQAGYGKAAQTWANGDFNYDGNVDFSDFLLLQAAYGKPALSETADPISVPEPATLSLLALGGLALLRRRSQKV